MADPRDAIRTLRAVPSVPTRLERVEEAVRSLAVDKDRHAALIDHLLNAVDDRVARLEALVSEAGDADRRRRALESSDAGPVAIHVLVLGADDPAPGREAMRRIGPDHMVATPSALPEAAREAHRDGAELVLVMTAVDLLGTAWPGAAVAALAVRPDAIAAYGERIDVLADGADAADATLLSRFETDSDAIGDTGTPAVELSGIVARADALAELQSAACSTRLDVVRALRAHGTLVPVPVTATVGPLRDPAT